MKTLGLIGGMSWESTSEYYRIINQTVREKLGPAHSCKSIIYSVNFADISSLQHQGKWETLASEMERIGICLEKAGADVIIICSNTMHIMVDTVQKAVGVPLLHIADATGEAIKDEGLKKVGLLGTKFTMENDFYSSLLKDKHGIETIIPTEDDREVVHEIIYTELISGKIFDRSRNKFLKVIERLAERGAEGVILGCTEIPLLVKQKDTFLPLFDTTLIHAKGAVELLLG